MRRLSGGGPPWTTDPVLAQYRFTNVYRAADRVSQYLIRHVLYAGSPSPEEVIFRLLVFKIFNRVETWTALTASLGELRWSDFRFTAYCRVLDGIKGAGASLYSPAYIMPSPAFGSPWKHRNHLLLIEHMMRDRVAAKVTAASTLQTVYESLLQYPSLGEFLAFQFAIDLNYSEVLGFSEMDFVQAGPGAREGIRKCFVDTNGFSDSDVIRIVADLANTEFQRLGIGFTTLWGRPLQLIDVQNLFCEVAKYSRVVHPEYSSDSGRVRIKQRFAPTSETLPQWYPPKWGLTPKSTPARRP